MSGELKRLVVEAFEDEKRLKSLAQYQVMLNPKAFSRSVKVEWETPEKKSEFGGFNVFSRVASEDMSVEFMIDGIGTTGEKRDVASDVEQFLAVCGKIPGNTKRPNYLRLNWGNLVFSCVLVDASIEYTLFKPNGEPLRATVKASFKEDRDQTLRTIEESRNLAANTNIQQVLEGDNLPGLAQSAYGDPTQYMNVAKANGIKNFRDLKPGSKIKFPKLK